MKETWSPIPGFVRRYSVSNYGRVRSDYRYVNSYYGTKEVQEKILKRSMRGPYRCISLLDSKGHLHTFSIHRLVLCAFVGPCPKGKEARHYPDRNPKNCRLDNLSWATKSENNSDKRLHKTMPDQHGSKGPRAKLTWSQARKIRRLYSTGQYFQREIGEMYGLTQQGIWDILHDKTWKEPNHV